MILEGDFTGKKLWRVLRIDICGQTSFGCFGYINVSLLIIGIFVFNLHIFKNFLKYFWKIL
ncbi:unnamed protein product [Meloidogyne enterolobii]|uniref:Uncharacterized protein n=1 Tax=Meloidogyne enterolobii TaxID=390850 RepID=A0ACB0YNF6_MELEN